jgi:RNA polymerase sigma-70 factor (ECF subfamily)
MPDIAQAFLVAEATMAARLTRTKKKIAAARIPYAAPSVDELPQRPDTVLTVIHLLYATGHTAHSGEDLVRDELTGRALDLARMFRLLLPANLKGAGLLALLLVHHARRTTRTDAHGRPLRLEEHDRSAWGPQADRRGRLARVAALSAGLPGRFTLQAAIAASHAQATRYAQTDWPQILTFHDELLRIWPSPVVALNRAVAVAMVDGPEAALGEIEALERAAWPATATYPRQRRISCIVGRDAEAAEAYKTALALSDNAAEQEFLAERARSTQPTS